jgi:hypothetical protein
MLLLLTHNRDPATGDDFVYEERAGKGVKIFVLDGGVNINVINAS